MWKKDYHELMYSKDIQKINPTEAFMLKYSKIPPSLFKFRAINEFSIDNLKNDTAWFSKATEFNDPYDSGLTINKEMVHYKKIKADFLKAFSVKFNVEFEEIAKICSCLSLDDSITVLMKTLDASDSQAESIRKEVDRIKNGTSDIYDKFISDISLEYQQRIFVSCFSEKDDSMLMWSHYARNHTGMCIEYDFAALDFKNKLVWDLHPVKYIYDLLDINEYSEEVRKKMSILTLAAISKSLEWEYEKEWRIILFEDKHNESFNSKLVTPKSIILGSRISVEDKELIVDIAKSKNIPLKQVQLDRTKYGLLVNELLI